MNYFGHVSLACQFNHAAEFLLGAALPDFASMLGCTVPGCSHALVTQGLVFHRVTDDVFHQLPTFETLVRGEQLALRECGMRKGPARALAHTCIELLLDAVLWHDPVRRRAFHDAVAIASPNRLGRNLVWKADGHSHRFERLRLRLVEHMQSRPNNAADTIAIRLFRTLSARPRLRLTIQEERTVADWVGPLQTRIHDTLGGLWLGLVREVSSRWSDQKKQVGLRILCVNSALFDVTSAHI